jgi:hypothetical protein
MSLLRNGFLRLSAAFALLSLALPAYAAESRVTIDRVEVEAKENYLRLHADVLDSKGAPVPSLTAGDLEILANGKPLKLSEVEIETAEQAQEPVAIVILLNASRGYQIQGAGEEHGTFQQAKEGAAQFIQRLKGNDMVAVVVYRESVPHEVVYSFASDFTQAKEAVLNYNVPAADLNPENNQGQAARERSLLPEFQSAVKKVLDFFNDNLASNTKLATAHRRFLVIMTDAKDRETRKDKLQPKLKKMVEEKIEENGIRIFAIGYSPDDEQYLSLLQDIANVSGGAYTYVPNKDGLGQIPSVFDAIATRIKKQYIIKAKWTELPDWGDPVKGKDEATYHIGLKVKMKDGAEAEAAFNDVHLPLPSLNWLKYLKLAGIVLGALLGVGLIILFIVFLVRRKHAAPVQVETRQAYDGPARGKLVVLAGPLAGETFPLIDDVTTIGSMKGNTIVIADGSVSRRHAAIKIDQMRYEVADMNSTNGVLVNGQRIHKVFMKDGDRVQIGTTELQFNLK